MKIGSFFLFLLIALVALGYLFSDSIHLREDMSNQQKEIERLTVTVQRTEQEKQDALIALQNAGLEVQSCWQTVEQSNQVITQLTEENSYLKQQNLLLVSQQTSDTSSVTPQPQAQPVQATALSLVAFLTLGFGSVVAIGLKSLQKHPKHAAKAGNYVYLTDAEIKELIQQRRKATSPNMPNSR